ncbi:dynein axonemal heavy chain 10-like isoform X2 [Lycorma delicatula]
MDFIVCTQIIETYLKRVVMSTDQRIPWWASLKYLIGEVMYGGWVIDDFDRRIVKTYMNEYMGDFLFDFFQPFHFYRDPTVDYVIPPDGTRDDYMVFVDSTKSTRIWLSNYLAPRDFHFFSHRKRDLKGNHYTTDDEVKETAATWIRERPPEVFSNGMQKLVTRWKSVSV